MSRIRIDVVSDVVCPWCFIGKRHLDRALVQWHAENPGSQVAVTWHPFFLNPDTPAGGEPYRPFLERKFGGPRRVEELWQTVSAAGRKAGIDFAFEQIELRANTLNAHRLIHHAQANVMSGEEPESASFADGAVRTVIGELVEALFAAQFLEGRHVGDNAVLADLAAACGLDREAVLHYLDSPEDAAAVRGSAAAARRRGIDGVPFFIFNDRLAASGAQPPDILLQAIRQADSAAAA